MEVMDIFAKGYGYYDIFIDLLIIMRRVKRLQVTGYRFEKSITLYITKMLFICQNIYMY